MQIANISKCNVQICSMYGLEIVKMGTSRVCEFIDHGAEGFMQDDQTLNRSPPVYRACETGAGRCRSASHVCEQAAYRRRAHGRERVGDRRKPERFVTRVCEQYGSRST